MFYKEKIKELFTSYKAIIVFVLPPILLAIVGSVVTRNKPDLMKPTLVAQGLACVMIISYITNLFIDFGHEYFLLKKESKHELLIVETINLIIWGLILTIFNTLYLLFCTLMYTDVTGFLGNHFFIGDPNYQIWTIDWLGFTISQIIAFMVSISLALLISQLLKKESHFLIIGGLYFLGYGYMSGGMFGPGATYWMFIFSLIIPHAYIAHFLAASFTNGNYVVAHSPSFYYVANSTTLINNGVITFNEIDGISTFHLDKFNSLNEEQYGKFMREIYIQKGSNIWSMNTWQPEIWLYDSYKLKIVEWNIPLLTFSNENIKVYNSFYQINAANIFVPLILSIISFITWWWKFVKNLKLPKSKKSKKY